MTAMNTKFFKKTIICGLIISFSGLSLTGISQSIKLEYKYPADKNLKYVTNTKIVEDMDVNGQSMMVNVARSLGCEIKGAGKVGQNVKVEVKIDSLYQNVESPQGNYGGSIKDVKGKSFNIIISPAGKLVDNSGGSKIVYKVEGGAETNIGQEFLNFFPSLPVKSIKPGDSWTTSDTINNQAAASKLWMPRETIYKFEGIEKSDGVDCARISATMTGTRKMITQSQGMEIHISGPFTGTETLLFAIKDGYFKKISISTNLNGKMEMPEQGMSFPVKMSIDAVSETGK
jgi:hypothetical protein